MSDEKKPKLSLNIKSPAKMGADQKKKWMIAGGVALVAVVFLSMTLGAKPDRRANTTPRETVINVSPQDLDKKTWQVQSQQEINELKKSNQRLEAKLNAAFAKLDNFEQGQAGARPNQGSNPASSLPGNIVPPPVNGSSSPDSLGNIPIPPPPPEPVVRRFNPNTGASEPVNTAIPPVQLPSFESAREIESKPKRFAPPARTQASDVSATADELSDQEIKTTYKKNEFAGFLPAGSFSNVVLLHGLDAATSNAAQSNPQPILFRVQADAVLPGKAKYKLKSCFALGSGFGDLSSERVNIRLASLNCTEKGGKLVLSAPIQGYVVDSDGKLGLRGVLEDRQGAKIGRAILAGFAEGMANAFQSAEQDVLSNVQSGLTSTVTTGSAGRSSLFAGAASAAQTLADFYIEQAENIFPVLVIDSGRKASIVISQGASLEWKESEDLFVKNITPITSN